MRDLPHEEVAAAVEAMDAAATTTVLTTAATTAPGPPLPRPNTTMIIKRKRRSPPPLEPGDASWTAATLHRRCRRVASPSPRPSNRRYLLITRCRCFRSRPRPILAARRFPACRRRSIRPSPVSSGPTLQTRKRRHRRRRPLRPLL